MRLAALYDIVVGGDVVPGPMPHETMAYRRDFDIPAQFIKGNGDREVLNLKRGLETGAYWLLIDTGIDPRHTTCRMQPRASERRRTRRRWNSPSGAC